MFLTNHSDPRPRLTGCSFTRWLEQSKKVFDRKWVNAEPLTWARTHVLMRDSHNAFRNHWIELTFSQEVNYKSHRFIYEAMDSKRLLSRDTCSVPRGNPMLPRLLDLQPQACQDYRVIKVREDSRQNNLDFTPHTQQTSSNEITHTAWCTHTNNYCVLWRKLLIYTPHTVQFNRTLYVLYVWVYISSSASEIHYCQNMCCSGWSMHVFIILSEQ